ncbi:MAG: heme exporter protein CcmB [Chloroflexi bacterium]|nr:heme exporter protein CcmB [Chloroflexota bacterium]
MIGFISKVFAILGKDLTAEIRSREILSGMFIFALLVILIFNFAFELQRGELASLAAGVLWVTFAFAGVLGLNRSFVLEKDRGSLEGLLLSPVDRGAIYLAKMLGNLIFILVTEAILVPLFAFVSNLALPLLPLLPVLLLGSLGFSAVGTVFAAMATSTRTREIMLPILLFPVVVPVVIAAVKATEVVFGGRDLSSVADWLRILIAFDVIFTVVSFLTFEYVISE